MTEMIIFGVNCRQLGCPAVTIRNNTYKTDYSLEIMQSKITRYV